MIFGGYLHEVVWETFWNKRSYILGPDPRFSKYTLCRDY